MPACRRYFVHHADLPAADLECFLAAFASIRRGVQAWVNTVIAKLLCLRAGTHAARLPFFGR